MEFEFEILPKTWIESTVINRLEKIVDQLSDKTAIIFEKEHISYKDLWIRIEKRKQEILHFNPSNEPIAILLDIEPDFIITKFACLSLGIPYIPLDINFPTNRNKQILEDSQAQLLISRSEHLKSRFETLKPHLLIDTTNELSQKSNHFTPTPNSFSYIIYTSGSTGKPKGVFQNQRNLLHDVCQYINAIELSQEDIVSYCYSPSVNGSIRDTFATLLVGGTLCLTNIKQKTIASLKTYLTENKITIFHAIPTIFRTLFIYHKDLQLTDVRMIYLAGDRIFKSDFELFKSHFNDKCKLYIGIGSTENATLFRHWILDKNTKINSNLVPVGYAIEDRKTEIFNENGNLVDVNEIGEIIVTSPYISLGYWKNKELTNEFFTFNSDGSRSFKTGDLGKINSEGLLEFYGRKDKQIKINGHRIELDEIRAIILSIQEIKQTHLHVRTKNNENKIIAYIESSEDKSIIINKLKEKLSPAQYPSEIYVLDKIPLLGNFKIDNKVLEELDYKNQTTESASLSIQELWKNYTKLNDNEIDTPLEEIGINSIDLIQLFVAIEKQVGFSFPPELITKNTTLSKVSKYIEEQQFSKQTKSQLSNSKIFIFPWFCGIRDPHAYLFKEISNHVEIEIIEYPTIKKSDTLDKITPDIANKLRENYDASKLNIFIGILDGGLCAYACANLLNINLPCIFINTDFTQVSNIEKLSISIKKQLNLRKQPTFYLKHKKYKQQNLHLLTFKNNKYLKDNELGWGKINKEINTIHFDFAFNQLNEKNILEVSQKTIDLIKSLIFK
jgi:fengycin family lipopeptide synthetase E